MEHAGHVDVADDGLASNANGGTVGHEGGAVEG